MSINDLQPENMTDEEVMQYADQVENPWVIRLLDIILQLETELAYCKEENMNLRVRYLHD